MTKFVLILSLLSLSLVSNTNYALAQSVKGSKALIRKVPKNVTPKPPSSAPITPKNIFPIALSGSELLVEALDETGNHNVYSVNLLRGQKAAQLQFAGASTPLWSLNHKKIAFNKGGSIFIHQLDGYQFKWVNAPSKEANKIFWDLSGKLNLISTRSAFGDIYSRSIGMKEDFVFKTSPQRIRGFLDTIIPVDQKGQSLSVSSATVSPDEKTIILQSHPSAPRNIAIGQSKLLKYKTLYVPDKVTERERALKLNEGKFLVSGSSPQLDGTPTYFASPPPDEINVEPKFSYSGDYVSINRINKKDGSMHPVVVDMNGGERVEVLNIQPILSNESKMHPDKVAGWPSHSAVGWSRHENQDVLWVVSGNNEYIYALQRSNGTWKATPVIGFDANRGSLSHYAFYQNYAVGIYITQPNRLYFYQLGEVQKDISYVDLPRDSRIESVSW